MHSQLLLKIGTKQKTQRFFLFFTSSLVQTPPYSSCILIPTHQLRNTLGDRTGSVCANNIGNSLPSPDASSSLADKTFVLVKSSQDFVTLDPVQEGVSFAPRDEGCFETDETSGDFHNGQKVTDETEVAAAATAECFEKSLCGDRDEIVIAENYLFPSENSFFEHDETSEKLVTTKNDVSEKYDDKLSASSFEMSETLSQPLLLGETSQTSVSCHDVFALNDRYESKQDETRRKYEANFTSHTNSNINDDDAKMVASEDDEYDSWDEDSVLQVRRSDVGCSRNSISSPEPNRLPPFSNDYHGESQRRMSTDTIPSRWRRPSYVQPQQQTQRSYYTPSSSSRSSVSREDSQAAPTASDGVFRSRSVHLFYRDPSPKPDISTPRNSSFSGVPRPAPDVKRNAYSPASYITPSQTAEPQKKSSFAAASTAPDKQRQPYTPSYLPASSSYSDVRKNAYSSNADSQKSVFQQSQSSNIRTANRTEAKFTSPPPPTREMRATSVMGLTYPPPPSMPPPPLPTPKFGTLERKFQSSENVKNDHSKSTSSPASAFERFGTSRPATEINVGYSSLRRTPSNLQSSDKIPSRFRRARDHAAAASNPDISSKTPDFSGQPPTAMATATKSDIHEQCRLAKIEHQRCCDEAKSFDSKKKLLQANRSKSFSSLASPAQGRTLASGNVTGLPPTNPESSLRRPVSRFAMR